MAKTKKKTPVKAKAKKATAVKAKKPALAKAKKPAKVVAAKKIAPKISAASLRLQPLHNRLVVEVLPGENTTPGGLFIPDTAQVSGNFRGTVLAVGTGLVNKKGKRRPMELKAGDQILFSDWAGDKIELNGKSVRILRESDVLGLVE